MAWDYAELLKMVKENYGIEKFIKGFAIIN